MIQWHTTDSRRADLDFRVDDSRLELTIRATVDRQASFSGLDWSSYAHIDAEPDVDSAMTYFLSQMHHTKAVGHTSLALLARGLPEGPLRESFRDQIDD